MNAREKAPLAAYEDMFDGDSDAGIFIPTRTKLNAKKPV